MWLSNFCCILYKLICHLQCVSYPIIAVSSLHPLLFQEKTIIMVVVLLWKKKGLLFYFFRMNRVYFKNSQIFYCTSQCQCKWKMRIQVPKLCIHNTESYMCKHVLLLEHLVSCWKQVAIRMHWTSDTLRNQKGGKGMVMNKRGLPLSAKSLEAKYIVGMGCSAHLRHRRCDDIQRVWSRNTGYQIQSQELTYIETLHIVDFKKNLLTWN